MEVDKKRYVQDKHVQYQPGRGKEEGEEEFGKISGMCEFFINTIDVKTIVCFYLKNEW